MSADADPVLSAGPDVTVVEALVDAYMAEGAQPGLAYGIVAGGRLVHSGGRGTRTGAGAAAGAAGPGPDRPADVPDAGTVFRIASMTKSFTAAALLLLRDEGVLALDDEVGRYVPELAVGHGSSADAPALTIRSLLTMAGGLPTDDPWGDRQQGLPAQAFTELLRGGVGLAWTPGTRFEYSNLGYAILGRVLEAVTGRPYAQVVTGRLLQPLGMSSTVLTAEEVDPGRLATGFTQVDGGWHAVPFDPCGAFAPMGGLFSTVQDLATWVAGYTGAYPPRDEAEAGHPLNRAGRRELQQAHRGIGPQLVWSSLHAPPSVRSLAYGFGLVVETDPELGDVVGHSGGYPGFGSNMRWHPGTGLGVVVLGNATYAPAHQLASRLLQALVRGHAARGGQDGGARPDGDLSAARVRGPAPAPGTVWPATAQARSAVDRLLAEWDDDLAADLFADNVDLDEPLARRRARIELLREELGGLLPDPASRVESLSPAHAAWWVRGSRGRARVEIRLTPQVPPRVQTLSVTPVPDPPPALRSAAEEFARALGEECPRWPEAVPTAPGFDVRAARRALLAGAAWAGRCAVAEVTGGDGATSATFRLRGGDADLVLTLALDPRGPAPAVARVRLLPAPPEGLPAP